MCDTFVALRNATRDGSVIFGKNSDREPNEAHELTFIPHAVHTQDETVRCTYIEIPQVPETNAVLLAKPFWIWGAEMGANEHGLVIGNEAVFTKVPYDKKPGLLGMDFLRLALERTSSAEEALDLIVELLQTYGQGGNHGFAHGLYYHNSFLIADRENAWVLETAGKHWAAEKVKDVRTISNVISIGSKWDRASDELVSHAISEGWCKTEADFDFGRCYSDLIFSRFADGRHRSCRTQMLLQERLGKIDLPFAMRVLRDHGEDTSDDFTPAKGLLGAEVCQHASFGPVRRSQTTGSMVSHLTPKGDTHWLTGTAAPCTSVFKPVWMESGLPDLGPSPTGTYDEATRWWQHENLHREILRDYTVRIRALKTHRDALEAEFIEQAEKMLVESPESRQALTKECFNYADDAETTWLAQIRVLPVVHRRPILDAFAWNNFDKQAERPH